MKAVKDWKVGTKDGGGPIATDFSAKSNVLLIAFGGLKRGVGRIAPFEFFNLTKDIETKKIYVRDMGQGWYHKGLPKIADNIDGIAKHLKGLVEKSDAQKVVVVGNSAGGYAALLFGCLINADVVHAFAPQTFISKAERKLHKDTRWEGAQIRNAHSSRTRQENYFNLKPVLNVRRGKTKFHVHYQSGSRLDRVHAERMRKIPGMVLHSYHEGGNDHYLVMHLRDNGKLKKILLKSLN